MVTLDVAESDMLRSTLRGSKRTAVLACALPGLTYAELKEHNPELLGVIRDESLRESRMAQGSNVPKIAQKASALAGLAAKIALARKEFKSVVESLPQLQESHYILQSLTCDKVKCSVAQLRLACPDLKFADNDCDALLAYNEPLHVEDVPAGEPAPNSIEDTAQRVAKDQEALEKNARAAIVVKKARDEYANTSPRIRGQATEKDWIGQSLDDEKIAHNDDDLKRWAPDLF